jgi:hypothetical protein
MEFRNEFSKPLYLTLFSSGRVAKNMTRGGKILRRDVFVARRKSGLFWACVLREGA